MTWCSTPPTELTSQLGAGHYVGSKETFQMVNNDCTSIAEVMGSNPVRA